MTASSRVKSARYQPKPRAFWGPGAKRCLGSAKEPRSFGRRVSENKIRLVRERFDPGSPEEENRKVE